MYGPHARSPWARPTPIFNPYYYSTPAPSDTELSTPSPPPSHLAKHFPASKDAASLPSRVAALNRRAALVAKNLEHLTQVVKPLEVVKAGELSGNHLRDMHIEGVALIQALHAFEEQTLEVLSVLGDVLKARSDEKKAREVEWEGEWEDEWFEGGGRTRVRARGGRK